MCFIRLPEKSLKFVFVCVRGGGCMWGWGGGVGKVRMKILKSWTVIN